MNTDTAAQGRLFTRLDLRLGYFHLRVDLEHVPYTGFVSQLGHYEFLVAPIGVFNSPAYFQNFINFILRKIEESVVSVFVYLYYVVIFHAFVLVVNIL